MNYSSPLYHYLTIKILIGAIRRNFFSPEMLFLAVFQIFRLGLPYPASSKCLIYYLCIIFTYILQNLFPLQVFFYPKNPKNNLFQPFFSFFSYVQDIYDLKCKNNIIIDEYEFHFPLVSKKNIDQSDLAQLILSKKTVFLYLGQVCYSQLPPNASSITCALYLHIFRGIFFLYLLFFTQKIKKNSQFQPFFSCFRHVQYMYDLKCENILIIDENELQFHLTSLFI